MFFSELKTASDAKLPEKTTVLIEETKIEVVQNTIIEDRYEISNLKSEISRPKRELPKSSSIGNMLKEIHQEVVQENKEVKIELTEETLPDLWTQFLSENREKLQNAFLSVAERQKPLLADGEITFIETNNISLELLQLHKIDIVSFFIKKTTSPTVHLHFKLNKKEELTKNYKTAKDRLKDMIDENPAVLELIKKLELNLE